jgi:hypothetical protein
MARRRVLAIVAAVLLGTLPRPAGAATEPTSRGGCEADVVQRDPGSVPTTGTHTYTGVLSTSALLYRNDVSVGGPVSATVTCTLSVNGVAYGVLRVSGTEVVEAVKRVSYVAGDGDDVRTCQTVDFTSDDTPDETRCSDDPGSVVPPSEIPDLVEEVRGYVDGPLCSAVGALAPGLPGVVDVDPGGDATFAGGVHWGCLGHRVTFPTVAPPVAPECSDGVDDDLDGLVDYPADPDCWGAGSDAEGLAVPLGS